MTNTPHGQVPEALRLAGELEASSQFPGNMRSCNNAAAAELRRLHTELETLTLYKNLADEYGLSIFKDLKDLTTEIENLREKLKTYEDLGDAGSDVQLLRMGYAAGMGDPLVTAAPAAVAGSSGYGPKVTVKRRCSDCKACNSESYAVQGDSGHYVYCEHPSLPERKYIGDTHWDTPDWCPAASPTTQPVSQQEAQEPAAWAFKYDDGTWHDPSTTEHSSGMRPLFAAPQPSPTAQAADSVLEDALIMQLAEALERARTIILGERQRLTAEDVLAMFDATCAARERMEASHEG